MAPQDTLSTVCLNYFPRLLSVKGNGTDMFEFGLKLKEKRMKKNLDNCTHRFALGQTEKLSKESLKKFILFKTGRLSFW